MTYQLNKKDIKIAPFQVKTGEHPSVKPDIKPQNFWHVYRSTPMNHCVGWNSKLKLWQSYNPINGSPENVTPEMFRICERLPIPLSNEGAKILNELLNTHPDNWFSII